MLQQKIDSITKVEKTSTSSRIKRTRSILKRKEDNRASMTEQDNNSNKHKRSVSFGPSSEIWFDKELPSKDVVRVLGMPYQLCHDRWGTCVAHSLSDCDTCSQSSRKNDIPRQPRRQ
jgi:hypothetical protein